MDAVASNEHKIVFYTCWAHALFHSFEVAFPALAIPLTLSLRLDLAAVLALGFPMYLLFGLCSLPWGIAADRFGNRRILILALFGAAAGALWTSLAASHVAIAASLAVTGAFISASHPAGMGFITGGVKNRGTALGINAVAGSVGLVAAPVLAGLLNWISGWRVVYGVLGAAALLGGLALAAARIDETPVPAGHRPELPPPADRGAHLRRLILFFWIVTLGGLAYRINIVSLPAYLELHAPFLSNILTSLRLPEHPATATFAATALTSLVYAAGIFGQLMGGKLADRHELRKLYLLFNAVAIPFVLGMALLREQPLFAAACLYVFFALGIQPIENSLIALFTPPAWRSTGFGVAAVLIFGVGSLAVYVVGGLKDSWGFPAVYGAAGCLMGLIVLHILLLMHWTRGTSFRNR
jgi:MFS family permease